MIIIYCILHGLAIYEVLICRNLRAFSRSRKCIISQLTKMLVLPRCEFLMALLTKILGGCDITPCRLKWEFAADILSLVKSSFTFETAFDLEETHQSARHHTRSKGIFKLRLWKSLLVSAYVVVLQCSHVRNVLL